MIIWSSHKPLRAYANLCGRHVMMQKMRWPSPTCTTIMHVHFALAERQICICAGTWQQRSQSGCIAGLVLGHFKDHKPFTLIHFLCT